MIARLSRIGAKHRRALLIGAVVTVVVLLIGAYVAWSANIWGTYKTTYQAWQNELHSSIDTALELPVANAGERSHKLAALKDVSETIASSEGSLCAVPRFAAWQRTFNSGLQEQEKACDQIIEKAGGFKDSLEEVTRYLGDNQALAAIIAKAAADGKDKTTEKTWDSQVTIWRSAREAIEKTPSGSAAFTLVRKSALDKSQQLEKAWQAVLAAHKAKNKAKYVATQTKLTQAYEELSEITAMDKRQFARIAASLQAAYAETFGSGT